MQTQDDRVVIRDLVAKEPAPDLRDRLALFGQLVGDWEIEGRLVQEDGGETRMRGQVHFGWILDGTAVQDVWTFRGEGSPPDQPERTAGTTIRFYDPGLAAWRCVWISPRRATVQLFVARALGGRIVLEGKTVDGRYPERWIYSDVTRESFHWHAEESHDGGATWLTTEVILGRRAVPAR